MHSVTICDDQSRIVSVIARNTLIFPGACCELHYINVSNPCFNFASQLTKLQSTVDAVEALFKRHEDFENTLVAQEEKFKL